MVTIKLAEVDFLKSINASSDNNAFILKNNNQILGYCLFTFIKNIVEVVIIECEDDTLLDGLIRQTLNYSLNKGYTVAKFNESVKKQLASSSIIQNITDNHLNITDFFIKSHKCQ